MDWEAPRVEYHELAERGPWVALAAVERGQFIRDLYKRDPAHALAVIQAIDATRRLFFRGPPEVSYTPVGHVRLATCLQRFPWTGFWVDVAPSGETQAYETNGFRVKRIPYPGS